MRVDVSFKNMEKSEYLEDIISKDVEKIKKRIRMFKSEDPVHLSLHLEKNPHKEQYSVAVNLYLPRKVLKAEEKYESVVLAINKSFLALIKQLDKHKALLERHLRKKSKA
ncbi:MAG: HPF/RaiA family ribosome-associated protein [Candidatus Omnitrophica bacterium]|nr:HPF/RaiA family ribosome-associated protein [Candidatus Omnitrophota bacterium]